MARLFVAGVSIAITSAAAQRPCATPIADAGWEVAPPDAAGFGAASLCAVFDEAAATQVNLHSLLVERHGNLVTELYRTGHDTPITVRYRMIYENVLELRGKAGKRQVKDVHTALSHNIGGHPTACGIAILGRDGCRARKRRATRGTHPGYSVSPECMLYPARPEIPPCRPLPCVTSRATGRSTPRSPS
jgi:hypothetical protein